MYGSMDRRGRESRMRRNCELREAFSAVSFVMSVSCSVRKKD